MRKLIVFSALAASVLVSACHHRPPLNEPYSKPVSIDSANIMISSYLVSIKDSINKEALRSLFYNADVLKDFLNSNQDIQKLKFVFAHTQEYINAGHYGQLPDSNSHAVTLVIVGVNSKGDYVYCNNMALDFCQPCPSNCPEIGNASSNLLIPARQHGGKK